MDSISERRLISEAKHGDSAAFAKLYGLYSTQLYRFALYYMRTPEDAEDAVQDTVLEAFRNISSLRSDDAFKAWMFRILSNICRKKLIRRTDRQCEISVDGEESVFADIPDTVPDPADRIGVRDAVGTLPPQDRQIVLLSVLAGYRSAEIAQMLDMNAATVRSRLSRSLARLRVVLCEEC